VPASASTGNGRPLTGSASWISPRAVLLGDVEGDTLQEQQLPVRVAHQAGLGVHPDQLARAREHVRDKRRQVCAVRLHTAQRGLVLHSRDVEQPLGRRVHQDDVPFLIGDENRVGDRIDDQVKPMALVANFRLRDPQRAVALLDLFLRARQVGDVAQNRHDVSALPLVFCP